MLRITLLTLAASTLFAACMDAGPHDDAFAAEDLETLSAALSAGDFDIDDPLSVPPGVRQRLRAMAQGEPCPFGGLILAEYVPDAAATLDGVSLPAVEGSYHIHGYNKHLDPVGSADGIYGGGDSVAHFESFGGGVSGSFEAEYWMLNANSGEFDGKWAVAIGSANGAIRGLYHPVAGQPGGVGAGFWTKCPAN